MEKTIAELASYAGLALGVKLPGPTRRSGGNRRPYADQTSFRKVGGPSTFQMCSSTAFK
jgi:hypothetical protein